MTHRWFYASVVGAALLSLVGSAVAASALSNPAGTIGGSVIDADTQEPLLGANIIVTGRFGGTMTDSLGGFSISNVSPGTYSLRVSHVGYETKVSRQILVETGKHTNLTVELSLKLVSLGGITVTPGSFTIMGADPTTHQTLTRREIETLPQFGEDLYRAVKRLPGLASNDFSARFSVRGGEHDEVLATIDGQQIYEPFHLKDIDGGVFGVIDVAVIENVDLLTGGYSAEYGDRMSGIFNMRTRNPMSGSKHVSVGMSFGGVRASSEGTFANNKGSWLLSARRGYLDLILALVGEGENLKPSYYDAFGKTSYQLGRNHIMTASFLQAGDDLKAIDTVDNNADTVLTSWDNTYAWLTLRSSLGAKTYAQTALSVGKVTHDRYGHDLSAWRQAPFIKATDIEDFHFVGMKSDWETEFSDHYLLKVGVDVRKLWTDYDYQSRLFNYDYHSDPDSAWVTLASIDSSFTAFGRSGTQFGSYLSNRIRLSRDLIVEAGLRYDRITHSDDELLSPRVSGSWNVSPKTTIRGAWGHYYQSHQIDQLNVGDGSFEFYPAERAEHRALGFEHDFGRGVQLRVEGYQKIYTDLRPAFRNNLDDIAAFPELENDRVAVYRKESRSRGIELFLKKDGAGKTSWRASYALTKAEDDVDSMVFVGGGVSNVGELTPSPLDQRHTLYLDATYRPNAKWQLNLAWQYHTGLPYTELHLTRVQTGPNSYNYYYQAGDKWGSRLPDYSRVDVRINRYFALWSGRINVYAEIVNLFDRQNVRNYLYEIVCTSWECYPDIEEEYWFGRLPSLGVSYTMGL